MNKKSYFLMLIMVIITIILVLVYQFTAPLIEQEIKHAQDKSIAELLGDNQNIIKTQNFELLSPAYLNMGDTQIATRAYDKTGPHFIIIKALTKGYSGPITLMLSLDNTCTLGTVEIINDHETPGLGDQYKKNDGAWLKTFSGKNNHNAHFALTRQGGSFDAWSGATVTPQAIVRELKRVLEMCERYHGPLFSEAEVVYAED